LIHFYKRVSQKSVRQQSAPTVPVVPSGAIFPVNPLTSQFPVVSSMASPSSQHPLVVSEYQKMKQDYWNGFLAVVRTPRSGCSLKLWSNQNYTFSRLGGDMMYLQKKSLPQTKCE